MKRPHHSGHPAKPKGFRRLAQYAMPTLTISANACTSTSHPQYAVLIGVIASIFWFYTGWQAWRQNGEAGIFITTAITAALNAYGIANYWTTGVKN